MTGSIITKKMSSGKDFFYVHLSYKDPFTQKWKTKDIRTGLEIKGNKRKAEALDNEIIEKYSYLERLTPEQSDIDPDIELCDFLDIWLEKKKVVFSYCLQYGKVSQKDQSQGPLSVRSVRIRTA